jgi:hypothetical protein
MPFYFKVLIFLVVLGAILFLISYRIKLDAKLNTILNNEIIKYSKTDLILTKICKVKDFDGETIVSFPINRRFWFFKQGILIYDENVTGFGLKSHSAWIYFDEKHKNMFTATIGKGKKTLIKNEKNKLTVEVYLISKKLPLSLNMENVKFEIEIEIPEYSYLS